MSSAHSNAKEAGRPDRSDLEVEVPQSGNVDAVDPVCQHQGDSAQKTGDSCGESARLQHASNLPPESAHATPPPSDELPNDAAFERAREAVSAVRGRGRQQNGQAGPGNTLAMRTGLRSSRLLNAPPVAAWHAEEVAAIEADLGGTAELSTLARASVREVARLEVILAAMGDELLTHGVLTAKGKTRAALMGYLQVLDRFTRLAMSLGLQRKARRIPTVDELLAGNSGGAQ